MVGLIEKTSQPEHIFKTSLLEQMDEMVEFDEDDSMFKDCEVVL